MSIFLELSNQVLEPAMPSTSVPQSMYVYLGSQQASMSSPLSLAAEVNDMKNLLRYFSNEIINLKRTQIPRARPPFQQNFQVNRPTYQQNQYVNNRASSSQSNGQIVPVPNPLQIVYPNTNKELTVGYNN